MTFQFTSGPAYVLFNIILVGYAIAMKAPFEVFAGYLFGALVYYTGRRAYRQIKLEQITVNGNGETNGKTP